MANRPASQGKMMKNFQQWTDLVVNGYDGYAWYDGYDGHDGYDEYG